MVDVHSQFLSVEPPQEKEPGAQSHKAVTSRFFSLRLIFTPCSFAWGASQPPLLRA